MHLVAAGASWSRDIKLLLRISESTLKEFFVKGMCVKSHATKKLHDSVAHWLSVNMELLEPLNFPSKHSFPIRSTSADTIKMYATTVIHQLALMQG